MTQIYTWQRVNHDPITLHKYLYTGIDPSGNSLINLAFGNNIQSTLLKTAVKHIVGVSLMTAILYNLTDQDVNYSRRERTAVDVRLGVVAASICAKSQNFSSGCTGKKESNLPEFIYDSDPDFRQKLGIGFENESVSVNQEVALKANREN